MKSFSRSTSLKQRRNAEDHNPFKNKGLLAQNPLPGQALAHAPKPPACLGVKQLNIQCFRNGVLALVPRSSKDYSLSLSGCLCLWGSQGLLGSCDPMVVQTVTAQTGCSEVCCQTLNTSKYH